MRRFVGLVVVGTVGIGLVGCSASTPAPPATSSAPASSAAPSPVASAAPTAPTAPVSSAAAVTGDAPGLVKAMWAQLSAASKQELCGVYADRGEQAGQVFAAGASMDQSVVMSQAEKDAIAAAGADLLHAAC